ncbi:MAG: hypothetical protein Udaeo_04880 [Candidatus Udaeobacter sp.]|nr:MAG: hypothetical protein Udaeo_04880 [Candidatus Udaeobacter sp.]
MLAIELSCAGIDRSRFDRAGKIVHRQGARCECRGVRLDANRALHSVNVHLRNARQDVDTLRYNGGRIFIKVSIGQRVRHQA